MAYLWFKSFHIVAFVSWFAGLFYMPRLFVYHAEANEQPEAVGKVLKQQYEIMEKRLYSIIMTPAMVVTVLMAIGMLSIAPDLLKETWLQVKIGLVAILMIYHFYCKRIMKRFAAGETPFTGQQFRWLNEFPTFLLVVVVMLAIFKNNIPRDATGYVVVAMAVAFAASIQLYARKRRLAREQAEKDALATAATSEA
ncbi:protoporphyrinogen oxidase HemJ [filamentous cyanobacterium LEGE 11480]|uniref:Protoporphyrinogen IX oxidase n=1 Tax=Romeriopsis navalis LEGE 11480 TaxID=2777977 RepID=A0A928Z397_9CYAN|nr:protoporphyrinogen oxidase HemJ [Romeriopsis navalis]MBE9030424.1 protoporphyrinogen oxidase HemJ [Romeriopsis navalis LEGE 11480]